MNSELVSLNVIESKQDKEDSGRDLEPARWKGQKREQQELEKEANSVHIGLKVTESKQERGDNSMELESKPRKQCDQLKNQLGTRTY